MKKIFFIIIIIPCLCNAQSVIKTMLRLPDTGVQADYTTTFGEDNDYTINAPYFLRHSDSTITDTVTGLMWQEQDGGEMTIENAAIYCDTLTRGGYTNWRLPNAHESFSILNHQHVNPALDNTIFTSTGADYWWTSTRQINDSNKVWVTNAGGGIGNHPKSETISAGGNKKFHVRAVRDVNLPIAIPAHFTDNGDGTVTDNLTDLVWQKNPLSDTLSWEQALNYADTVSIGGHNDWRLPNIKELQSINDESLISPSVSTTFFPTIGVKKYWSSTTLPNHITESWYLDTQFGITTYDLKTGKHYVICVRGNLNTPTTVHEITSAPSFMVYPNPFHSFIRLKSALGNEQYELYNSVGQQIYSGANIETQNFTRLPAGIYFLRITGISNSVMKLTKE